MSKIFRPDLSFIFGDIAELLDISESLFEEAENKYRAVGKWLGEEGSPLAIFSPEIYPQGSALLGTLTKPLGDKDEYDFDLVLELILSKDRLSQKRLKNLVGDRIKDHALYRKMLDEEGRRCWTIVYADGAKFHLDILPAIPDADYRAILKMRGVQNHLAETGIAFTDRTLSNYEKVDPDWPSGNPKGFASWFRSRMITQYEAQRKRVAEVLKAEIERVPDYRIKTPLQRSVQLLKRHRDITFENKDDKPASIIITTLAAHAYNNEVDIVEAITNIANGMPNYVTRRNGIPWVQNPVDPSENFADRWQERPGREQDFRGWLKKVQYDINAILRSDNIDQICELLESLFGERVATTSVTKYKEYTQERIRSINPVITIVDPNKPWGF